MDDRAQLTVSPDQLSCAIGDDVVLLNQASGTFYSLGNVGARVWDILQSGTTVGDLHQTILNEYEVEPGRASADLIRLLAELERHGLIVVVTAGKSSPVNGERGIASPQTN